MSKGTVAEVVPLYESNYRDTAATLRCIADAIEAGEYGDVHEATLVLKADGLEVFGMGRDSDGATCVLLLQCGIHKLTAAAIAG